MRGLAVLLVMALCGCSDRARSDAAAYARGFSLAPISLDASELRIWTEEYVNGDVRGYVIRPGEISIYEAYPGLGFKTGTETGPVHSSAVRTPVADELLRGAGTLRRAQFDNCEVAMDGGSVIVEGNDDGRYFAFSILNFDLCQGGGVETLNHTFSLLDSIDPPPTWP
jgi:hypothetical protein